ncbi:MAG: LacI family transcriptional regulator [Clostridiales bacterium]|nr:LacI family transcriptional regulator [Clostridiales bacterium]
MNIYDISKKAGVSTATVSRVINGSSAVSPKTREKVLKVIEESGYSPNIFARGLGLNSMNTIGLLCADVSDMYIAQGISFIERGLREHGYDTILSCAGYLQERKEKALKLLLSKRVDAVICVGSSFVSCQENNNHYILEGAKEVPIMVLNAFLNVPNVYGVLCDDTAAVFDATTRLIQKGIHQILYLYDHLSYCGHKKLKGYKDAFLQAGLPVKQEYIRCALDISPSPTISQITAFVQSLANNGLVFNGAITTDDWLAVGVIKYAAKENISIPNQLSVVGYNNSSLAICCEPELTSIDNKLQLICQHCVTTLMQVLSKKEAPSQTIFSADIITRNTTAADF